MEAISNRMYQPWYHLDCLYKFSPTYEEDLRNFRRVNEFMEELISHKRNSSENTKEQDGFTKSKDIFIDHIAKYVHEGRISWDDVRDEANVIIAAAFETTSITLFITFLCLAVFQDVQENLYNELCSLFPKLSDVDDISEETMKEM
uniref:Uncharacterized protein n=1 Tax=Megaselia scalaris TaxID=36166 RepID=T1GSC1_MEGSC